MDSEKFERAGITLEYMQYKYPEYPQLYPPFDPHVSILDLLFMTGSEATSIHFQRKLMPNIPNLDHVKSYFDKRIREHGASPRGSDWNSETSQNIRFDQLLKVVEVSNLFNSGLRMWLWSPGGLSGHQGLRCRLLWVRYSRKRDRDGAPGTSESSAPNLLHTIRSKSADLRLHGCQRHLQLSRRAVL